MPKTTPIKVRRCARVTTPFYVRVPDEIKQRFPIKYPQSKRFFPNKSQAQHFCDELVAVQRRAESITAGLTEAQTFEAAECFARLEPRGRTLREAVDDFLSRLDVQERSITLAVLVKEAVQAKRDSKLSAAYIPTFESRLRRFARGQEGRTVSEFTTAQVDEWLRKHVENPQTRNNYRSDLRTMFAFALTRRYVTHNPVIGIAKTKQVDAEVEALTAEEVRRLLHASDGHVLPEAAINAFAGIRPGEIDRLIWANIDFEHREIDVKATKSKTGQRRIVRMSDNLLAWLTPFRERTGLIVPRDTRTRYENTRERAGLTRWPHDCLRHSYATRLALAWRVGMIRQHGMEPNAELLDMLTRATRMARAGGGFEEVYGGNAEYENNQVVAREVAHWATPYAEAA